MARVMREHGIRGETRRRRRWLTRPDGKAPPAPDLLRRDFTAPGPGLRLVGDITCPATCEGWVYLAVLIDLCTRRVVSWTTATRQTAALTIAMVSTAHERGNLAAQSIVHTDRGAQYTARAYCLP
ncbi:MAG TPA: DDE-type integrase/transposase/recombinase [Actinocrinis sp.]